MDKDNKRFQEDWINVDCNECSHYWDSSCDGNETDKPCNSYKASRKVSIPGRIEKLEKSVKWTDISLVILTISVLIHLIGHIIGWY